MNNNVYSEVYTILNQLDENDLRKIPEDILFFIKANMGEELDYIDKNKSLDEIKITKEAEDMLALISYYYFCDDTEKTEMNKVMEENEKQYQEELREKYNPDDVFINEMVSNDNKNNKSNIEIAEVALKKENFISKLINKVRDYFKRK